MINIKTLLSSALFFTLSSSISMATDFYSHADFKTSITSASIDTLFFATDAWPECMMIDDSTAASWNLGEFCFVDPSRTNLSIASSTRNRANLALSQNIFEGTEGSGAECISDGGSAAASDKIGGFCLALDLNNSIKDFANFAVANELPVEGMQFLQATFGDGSTLASSAPISAECISAGGSISDSENAAGFCLASDLTKSTMAFANFAAANGISVVGLQFLQVVFADGGAFSSTGAGSAECASIGGSTAVTGNSGGFCLAADLSTSVAGFANFAVAHDVSITDLQFLQATFADRSGGSLPSPGAGAPIGAECTSVEGSIAAIENPDGFCLVSDLIQSSIISADITIANDLPVSGMQFLQMKFADGGSLDELPSSLGGEECISGEGSSAVTGNTEGFCLVSDQISSAMESASISVANALPVIAWEFLQVPSEEVSPRAGFSDFLSASVPVSLVVSNLVALPFDFTTLPSLLDIVHSQAPFLHLSNQINGTDEEYSAPYWQRYPYLGLWVGR